VLAGVALACGVLFLISREQGFEEAHIRLSWLAGAWRLAVRIPADIALVSWAVLAQLVRPQASRGVFRAVRFRYVEMTPPEAGRRGLTEAVGSVAPNTIVIGVDAESGLLLVHQLCRQGDARDLDLLRLG
jgi:hypothetical protein